MFFIAVANNSFAQSSPKTSNLVIKEDVDESGRPGNPAGRMEYELMRLKDPVTGIIPMRILEKELRFSSHIPAREQFDASSHPKNSNEIQSTTWTLRGPQNIGGRSPALGIDIKNENIILAGSTSGGMWRSTDKGSSWVRTTSLNQLPNISHLAQDTRTGKTNTWYYSTGEVDYGSAGWPPQYGNFIGNGIFKSTDDGQTWFVLNSTVSTDSVNLTGPFNYVAKVAIDPSNTSQDIVYAAVQGGVMRSSDGGNTWAMTLGNYPTGSHVTDVAVTSTGNVYAAMSGISVQGKNSSTPGMYRSTDGINWVNITPAGWQQNIYEIYFGVAPSNEKVLYVSAGGIQGNTYPNYFWKYTYVSGDGTGSAGVWEDRSANFNNSGMEYDGYVKVKPDDENTIFTGRLNLWRSTDGLATTTKVTNMSMLNGYIDLHVDHEIMVFSPSNPKSIIIGCDGGLFQTDNDLADGVIWNSLDNNYVTAQFYSVAIDHSNAGDETIIGGTQDNGTSWTNSTDETNPWTFLFGGDGATCAISKDRGSYYVSYQQGHMFREVVDDNGTVLDYTRIDPTGGVGYIWINPYALDPNNTDRMYLGAGNYLWRNNNLTLIPLGSQDTTSVEWDKLSLARVSGAVISAVAVSTVPPNRVYYGTTDSRLYRLDSADAGNPKPISIGTGKGFPAKSFTNCIAVDPANADNVIAVFANYNIQSLFYTSDGGTTWTPIGGNLEENPDGSGNGPSCRWASFLHVGKGIVYLVATSTGLYSTSALNGKSTVWVLEGASAIGNSVIDMIDTRQSDGRVAVGTHGHGMFAGNITSVPFSVNEKNQTNIIWSQNHPNPFSKSTTIDLNLPKSGFVNLQIYNMLGEKVAALANGFVTEGAHSLLWNATPISEGIYFCHLEFDGMMKTQVLVKE